jgi:hypothetical protein
VEVKTNIEIIASHKNSIIQHIKEKSRYKDNVLDLKGGFFTHSILSKIDEYIIGAWGNPLNMYLFLSPTSYLSLNEDITKIANSLGQEVKEEPIKNIETHIGKYSLHQHEDFGNVAIAIDWDCDQVIGITEYIKTHPVLSIYNPNRFYVIENIGFNLTSEEADDMPVIKGCEPISHLAPAPKD